MKEYAFFRHAVSFFSTFFFFNFLAVLDLCCFAQAFSSCAEWRPLLLQCVDFSLWGLLLLGRPFSRCVDFGSCSSQALEHRLSSCGPWASLLRSTWSLPGSGIKPMSLALARGLLSTAPLGNSEHLFLYYVSQLPWRLCTATHT